MGSARLLDLEDEDLAVLAAVAKAVAGGLAEGLEVLDRARVGRVDLDDLARRHVLHGPAGRRTGRGQRRPLVSSSLSLMAARASLPRSLTVRRREPR